MYFSFKVPEKFSHIHVLSPPQYLRHVGYYDQVNIYRINDIIS